MYILNMSYKIAIFLLQMYDLVLQKKKKNHLHKFCKRTWNV